MSPSVSPSVWLKITARGQSRQRGSSPSWGSPLLGVERLGTPRAPGISPGWCEWVMERWQDGDRWMEKWHVTFLREQRPPAVAQSPRYPKAAVRGERGVPHPKAPLSHPCTMGTQGSPPPDSQGSQHPWERIPRLHPLHLAEQGGRRRGCWHQVLPHGPLLRAGEWKQIAKQQEKKKKINHRVSSSIRSWEQTDSCHINMSQPGKRRGNIFISSIR